MRYFLFGHLIFYKKISVLEEVQSKNCIHLRAWTISTLLNTAHSSTPSPVLAEQMLRQCSSTAHFAVQIIFKFCRSRCPTALYRKSGRVASQFCKPTRHWQLNSGNYQDTCILLSHSTRPCALQRVNRGTGWIIMEHSNQESTHMAGMQTAPTQTQNSDFSKQNLKCSNCDHDQPVVPDGNRKMGTNDGPQSGRKTNVQNSSAQSVIYTLQWKKSPTWSNAHGKTCDLQATTLQSVRAENDWIPSPNETEIICCCNQ